MTHTLLQYQADLLIPLFAIIFTFSIPILAIYFYYKQKSRIMDERKLMIEKGMVPPDMKSQLNADSDTQSPLSKGMNLLAIALGLLIGYFVSTQWHTNQGISIACGILFFLGLSNVLKSFLLPTKTEDHE